METINRDARMALVNAAVADEMTRLNTACRAGMVTIDEPATLCHGRRVLYVTRDFDVITGHEHGAWETQTWAFCNDGSWARLLARASVARNPLFV